MKKCPHINSTTAFIFEPMFYGCMRERKLILVPRQVTSNCGLCGTFPCEDGLYLILVKLNTDGDKKKKDHYLWERCQNLLFDIPNQSISRKLETLGHIEFWHVDPNQKPSVSRFRWSRWRWIVINYESSRIHGSISLSPLSTWLFMCPHWIVSSPKGI